MRRAFFLVVLFFDAESQIQVSLPMSDFLSHTPQSDGLSYGEIRRQGDFYRFRRMRQPLTDLQTYMGSGKKI